jgi:hypothetical protein
MWEAPALSCFPLKQINYIGPAGGELKALNVYTAKSVVVGEPEASLFAVPSGFTERSPSGEAREFARRYPKAAQASAPAHPVQDDIYYGHHKRP